MSQRQIDLFHRLPTATLHKRLTEHLEAVRRSPHTYVATARMRTIGNLRTVLRLRGETV